MVEFKKVMYKPNIVLTNWGDRLSVACIDIVIVEYAWLGVHYNKDKHVFNLYYKTTIELGNLKVHDKNYESKNCCPLNYSWEITEEIISEHLESLGFKSIAELNTEYYEFLENYNLMELNMRDMLVKYEENMEKRIESVRKRKAILTKKTSNLLEIQEKYLHYLD